MAFAFFNLFEPSIVKNIYEFARIEPTLAHVLFQNHPMLPQEEFFTTLPNERATIGELQEEMSQMARFKENNWFPDEMHFFLRPTKTRRRWAPTSSLTTTGL